MKSMIQRLLDGELSYPPKNMGKLTSTHTAASLEVSDSAFNEIRNKFKKLSEELDPSYWYEYTDCRKLDQEPKELQLGKITLIREEKQNREDKRNLFWEILNELAEYGEIAVVEKSLKHEVAIDLSKSNLVSLEPDWCVEFGSCIRVSLKKKFFPYPVSWMPK
jgi:hypothetical protein